jgi:lantibiotic modifying enzyme
MCHGWAGLLHIATLMARDTGDDGLAATARRLASEIVRRFDSEAPFGYRYWADGKGADQPGFLTGATGIALALLAFTDGRVTSGWDRCLLLD